VSDAQCLRARAIVRQHRGDVAAALDALQRSATVARTQRAVIQLGRTQELLSEIGCFAGDWRLAEADAERAPIVERISRAIAVRFAGSVTTTNCG
jgi:hypothetical protein